MSGYIVSKKNQSPIEWELYFLIERFLSSGPCKSAANVLRRELVERELLPKRIDWEGGEHERSYQSLLEINKHIGGNHLLKICQRLGPLLDEKIRPHITGIGSLLGAGTQSLLRTEQDIQQTEWPPVTHLAQQNGRPKFPPHNMVVPNWLFVRRGMEMSGQSHFGHIIPTCMYARMQRLSRKLGHLSAVYCVLFDRTGEFVFTGADDNLVKIWWVVDSRLKATLRGHSAEITDMDVNYENTLLASGSCDRTIRVWCLQTRAPTAVLQGHTGMITSVQFSPMVRGNRRYLASTGGDACVCFWEWTANDNVFNARPVKYVEKSRAGAQVLCSSFSPGGMFYAAGSTDNVIRMYHFHAGYPEKIGELEKHTDRVDSICYANHDNRFLSGSKDGTARIWKFERNEWRNIVLDMSIKLPEMSVDSDERKQSGSRIPGSEETVPPKLRVTMVAWSSDDKLVITAVNDHVIKVWCSFTGRLVHELKGHTDEVFVLESCKSDHRIILSAGHDGNIIVWNIINGSQVRQFFNQIEGQGHGAVFDCKLASDGGSFIATDSHGHMMIYGHASPEKYSAVPNDVFFHTDYRPLMRDSNNYVLDEQTQQAPHLMPPPFLVDIDGNPYPPLLQRLVPGRESVRDEQLIPEFHVNEEGEQEVVGDRVLEEPALPLPPPEGQGQEVSPAPVSGENNPGARPSIDQLIEQLQREQDQRLASTRRTPMGSPPPPPQLGSPRPRAGPSRSNSVVAGVSTAGGSHMVGMRRVGETEGVRQSLGNMQVSTPRDLAALTRRIVVKGLDSAVLRKSEELRIALADHEIKQYNNERRKKSLEEPVDFGIQTRKKKKNRHGYTTRANLDDDAATNRLTRLALYDTDEEIRSGAGSDMWEEEEILDDPGDSSDYSDWCMDTGSNLQPPQRKSTRVRKRRRLTSSEFEDSDDTSMPDSQPASREGSQTRRREGSLIPGGQTRSREGSQARGKALARKSETGKAPVQKKRKSLKKKQSAREAAMLPGKSAEEIQDLVARFRPSDWLTDVIPRKQPYFPQMGDEVVYLRQGHELYVKAVERRKVYPIDSSKGQPWHKYPSLKEKELVRIVGIRYEVLKTGTRLCCLKLNYIDPVTLRNTSGSFNIKYHDMTDVVDFLVIKQNYDIAMARKWGPGSRFRSMIDDSWWMGIIEEQIPFQAEYPDSLFQCFKVRWDNAEREFLSPWDLEPMEESRPPSVIGGGVLVTPEELKGLMYKPRSSEWPGGPMDQECDRIVHGWEQVMGHSIAEPFLTPVDLNAFPSYAVTIEYPMDLNTIKRRLENRFYRRVTALQFDLRYIESNAKTFNEPNSQIVKSAQILCDALLKFIGDVDSSDPCQLINKLVHGRKIHWSSDSGEATEDYDTPGTSTHKHPQDDATPGTSKSSRRRRHLSVVGVNPDGWKVECQQLMATIMQCEDSEPFRTPVNIDEYPDYYAVIENPMDLGIVGEKLEGGEYTDPTQLARDMAHIFSNSKFYNTNKRSRIYTMTLRLSAMFDSHMKEIISTWRKAIKKSGHGYPPQSSARFGHDGPHTNGAGPSHSAVSRGRPNRSSHRLTNGITHHSDSDVDITSIPPSKQHASNARKRPLRERRSVRRPVGYLFSDGENHDFPEPKPDYTDDDFEIDLEPKRSPKKKAPVQRSKPANSQGSEQDNSGSVYSTRARTGTLKTRKYTNEGFFTDEEEEDIESVISDSAKAKGSQKKQRSIKKTQESSNSDTEIEETLPTSIRSRVTQVKSEVATNIRGDSEPDSEGESSDSATESDSEPVKRKPTRGRQKGKQPARSPKKGKSKAHSRKMKGTGRKKKWQRNNASEEEINEESDGNTTSNTKSSSDSEEGWETDSIEHNPLPQTRGSQKSSCVQHISEQSESSDSGPPRKRSKIKASGKGLSNGSRSKGNRSTRNRGRRTVKYKEESGNSESEMESSVTASSRERVRKPTARVKYNEDSGNSESETESSVTVSSRGRVRKPTARARAMLY
ncbi:PH-interacting protein-like isoform X2 [Mya arenaria]|uniref:PH-interacting protein-like isoform X2 n=1 Tax=Mya arenaria TaxID=6604 RepID=UPI0022DF5D0B|nr:PH-interacting protein-like isoform X2 [Mya arenaria]